MALAPETPARAAGAAGNRVFLLVHGAWHNALHWNEVAIRLTSAGARVVAVDLPGHGLNARLTPSYLAQDGEALLSAPSPHKDVTLDDYVGAVGDVIAGIDDAAEITLVGHSMSGVVVTKAGEAGAARLKRIVYVTAYVPVRLPSSLAYIGLPENRSGRGDVFIGDPAKTGAVRVNPRSADPDYLGKLHQTFYGDMPFEAAAAWLNALTPDLPLGPVNSDARGTAEGWGKVPRSYVRCTRDAAIPLALQDLMIREADEAYPDNRFAVHTLESSHSPFASMPQALADILLAGA